jgi:uncharacterized protein (TIGR00730 family)
MTICVFASSSSRVNSEFGTAAAILGSLLAQSGMDVVYGGGGIGLMGKFADAVLKDGGKITGVIPVFMKEEGWGHQGLTSMIVTPDMGERKKTLFSMSDAIVALPGGVGTLEELTEAITLKQLSLYDGPVIILNTLGFYKSFFEFLDNMVETHFLRKEHKGLWEVANTPEEVIIALNRKDRINEAWRGIAKI